MKQVVVFSPSETYTSAIQRVFQDFLENCVSIVEDGQFRTMIDDSHFAEDVYLVILDTSPNQLYDGYAIIERLRSSSNTHSIPVLVLSAQHTKNDRLKAFSLGASDYIPFPISREEVRIKINHLVEQYLENRNIKEGLVLLSGMRQAANSSREQTDRIQQELDNMLAAQEAVFEMSRQELMEANQKLKDSYEAKLQAVEEKGELQMIFGKFISPQIVEYLMRHDGMRTLNGEKKDISLLFADIRGFSGLSEQVEPNKVVFLLNEFFTELTEIIIQHSGIVDKYTGDNIMAIFGAPVELQNHHRFALKAAWEMQQRFRILQENWEQMYGIKAGLGIGINCGPAIVGNIGSYHKISYTAIGDMVNTAARFEQIAKDGQILFGKYVKMRISDQFLTEHGFRVETLGETTIKGKQGYYQIYNLAGSESNAQ